MLEIANILLVSRAGDLLMQLRDDIPGITNPGKVTAFGGRMEDGESPVEAAVRELKEETGLGVGTSDLRLLGKYKKTRAVHGEDSVVHVFLLEDVDPDDVTVLEGQGLEVVRPGDNLEPINFSILARRLVGDYFKQETRM